MLVDIDGIVKYSDEMYRHHYAEVIDNKDPKKIGRIKVKITSIFEGSASDLPWVYPHQKAPSSFIVPEIGEKVKVRFVNGDIYHPEYVGFYHSTVNHDTEFDDDYPDTFGIHRQGFVAKYNMKKELLEVKAKNGSKFLMNKDGDAEFVMTKDFKVTAKEVKFTADGKVDVTASGDVTFKSDGTATFSGKSKTIVGDSSSQTMVNGSTVLLAGGGSPVALVGGQTIGTGNLGAPVVSQITTGSSKVSAAQ
jgi:hypothetical protein